MKKIYAFLITSLIIFSSLQSGAAEFKQYTNVTKFQFTHESKMGHGLYKIEDTKSNVIIYIYREPGLDPVIQTVQIKPEENKRYYK